MSPLNTPIPMGGYKEFLSVKSVSTQLLANKQLTVHAEPRC